MYAIRVRVEEALVEVRASRQVAPEEALRAVSQAFALAEAGSISRGICDVTEVGRHASSLIVLGAAFAARFTSQHRVAVVCGPGQLTFCRRLARLSGFGDNFGLFTRESDAREWISARAASSCPQTTLRHLAGQAPERRDQARAAS